MLAIIDERLANAIRHGNGNWREIQKNAVSISKYNREKWHVKVIKGEIYQWMLPYNSFIGYMAGVLDDIEFEHGILMI